MSGKLFTEIPDMFTYAESSIRYQNVVTQFLGHIPTNQYAADASQTRKLETDRRHLCERRENLSREVHEMEVSMGIQRRWEATDDEYIEMTKYIATRKYHRALDELQRLVVQRLFELHKLNLAQTG
jgi:hypothetical protein